MEFVGIIGNNAVNSTNRTLLQYVQEHFKDRDKIILSEIKDIPAFTKPESHEAPEIVAKLSEQIVNADGVIIVTPEYDHSVPASLINVLEWLAYTTKPLQDKPVLILGASYGSLGTSRAQGHLRLMLNAPDLRARVLPGQEFLLGHALQSFDKNGRLVDQEQVKALEEHMTYFEKFASVNSVK